MAEKTVTPDELRKVKARMMTITPAIAEKMLGRNLPNRKVRSNTVKQYAADMKAGAWAFNGEAIKIAHTGQILDGQHRLIAVMESDCEIETLVITGLEPEAQETMDLGRARSLGDVLKIRGEHDYYVLGAALKTVALFERDGVPFPLGGPGFALPTIHKLLQTLERNPELRDSVKMAAQLRRGALLPSGTVSAFHYLFSIASEEDATDFFTRLLRGENISSTDAIYVLRDRLVLDLRERLLPPKVKLAFLIRTWNAYRQGERIQRLLWTPGGAHPDKFPRIDGVAHQAHQDDDEADAA